MTVAACAGPTSGSRSDGASEGSLRVVRPADATTLDPIATGDQWSARTQTAVYARLVAYTGGAFKPDLASDWSVSDDGRQYTFTLGDNKFSDGSSVTAQDVAFSLKRARSADSQWTFLFGPTTDVVATAENTVQITLSAPYPPLLSALSTFAGSVYSKAAFEKDGAEKFFQQPISSGPYFVSNWSRGTSLTLKANSGYHVTGSSTGPAEIDFSVTADDNSRMQQLQAGAVDLVEAVPPTRAKDLATTGAKLVTVPGAASSWVQFNVKRPGLDNRDVRCALAGALNRAAIAQTAFRGVAEPSTSVLPASTLYHKDVSADMPTFDVDAARKRLDSAAVPGPLSFTVTTTGEVAGLPDALQIWRSDLDAIGVKLKVDSVEATTQRTQRNAGDYDAITVPWINDTPDPSELAGFVLHSNPKTGAFYTGYADQATDSLVERAAAEQGTTLRAGDYAELQKKAAEDCVFVPIVDRADLYAVAPGIDNFMPDAFGNYNFQQVRVQHQ